jgi:DNA-binding transcriptional regulator YdaS (Cro superfamily)
MIKLKEWLDEERGRVRRLAEELRVPTSFVFRMSSGTKGIPIRHMAAIEKFTEGAVTRRDMCPEDWERIWPELADQQAEGQGV